MSPNSTPRHGRGGRHRLVASLEAAVENISRYQTEVCEERELARRMRRARVWYGIRSELGAWHFAPSKFVGYAENSGRTHVSEGSRRDGGKTELVLGRWFDVVPRGTSLGAELHAALHSFHRRHGHSGPGRNVRVRVLRAVLEARGAERRRALDRDGAKDESRGRVRVDPSVCGGRPHIRGTRVRVSDILDLLAGGVAQSDILADYPYLSEADVRAALAFGADATEHRMILTA